MDDTLPSHGKKSWYRVGDTMKLKIPPNAFHPDFVNVVKNATHPRLSAIFAKFKQHRFQPHQKLVSVCKRVFDKRYKTSRVDSHVLYSVLSHMF